MPITDSNSVVIDDSIPLTSKRVLVVLPWSVVVKWVFNGPMGYIIYFGKGTQKQLMSIIPYI